MSTTSQIQSSSNNYWIPLVKNYTGTANQPDVVTFFLKSRQSSQEIKFKDEQIINSTGHHPCQFITAIPRIKKAIKVMFREIQQKTCCNADSEFWNAFKNGTRSILQFVPLLGNAVLYIFDKLRTTLYTHPTLTKELSNQEEVIGIAFDGKPIFSIATNAVNPLYTTESRDADAVLALMAYTWLELKSRCIEQRSPITTRELVDKFRQILVQPTT